MESPEDLKPMGGGGTTYSPVWEYIKEHQIECHMAVYATDGYCSDFGEEPPYPVYWVIIPGGMQGFDPPFGQVLYIS